MKKSLALALTVAALGLAGCAPAPGPAPVSNQAYGGKYDGGGVVSRGNLRCPSWANVMHRGDIYCLKNGASNL